MKKLLAFLFVFIGLSTEAKDIGLALECVENGQLARAEKILKSLKASKPDDPDVIYLGARLSENAETACSAYRLLYKNHPESKYAAEAIFRICTFYLSTGEYEKADQSIVMLRRKYPDFELSRNMIGKRPAENEEPGKPKKPVQAQEKPRQFTKEQISGRKNGRGIQFRLRVGSYQSAAAANSMAGKIRSLGYTARITQETVRGKKLNTLFAGNFGRTSEAEALRMTLKKQYGIQARLVPQD